MTPPDLSDEQIEQLIARCRSTANSQRKHAEGWHRRLAHSEAFNAEGIADKFDAAASALEQMALRVRALEQERDDAKSDALRLHKDKMELWEAINFPGGWKERAEASAKDAARVDWWARNPDASHSILVDMPGDGSVVLHWDDLSTGKECNVVAKDLRTAIDLAAKEQPHG